jgi:transglutaminase/protease-like cytokinesis protein 3
MKTYTLDQSNLDKEKKSIMLMYGITLLVLVAIAVSINWGRDTMQSLVWLIPLMAGMYVFMGFRSYKQRKDFYQGYKLELTEDMLIQNQPRMRELKFALADITNVEVQKKGLLISIKQAKNVLGVSKDTMKVEDYEELKDTLLDWVKQNSSESEQGMRSLEDQPIEGAFDEMVEDTEDLVDEAAEHDEEAVQDVAEDVSEDLVDDQT